MISLIKPDDQDFKPYVLKVSDLAYFLNINIKNAYREADKITSRLMERVLHIPQGNGAMLKVHWVSSALHENGSVELSFSPKLKPYLLQLKEQFTKYSLSIITQFQSTYAIRIYTLLKQYEKIGYREFELEELRGILGIKPSEYKEFKRFRQWVINQAQKEFSEKLKSGGYKSDINFDLETIRTGRKITGLKFKIKKQAYQEELPLMHQTTPAEINKLIYYGLTEKEASALFTKHGAERIEAALDLYTKRVEAGKVKSLSGGYLRTLINEGAGKSEFEREQEAATERKKVELLEAKEKQLKAQNEEARKAKKAREKNLAEYEGLTKADKAELLAEFEASLTLGVARKNYKKSGLDHPMISGLFNHFLGEHFLSEKAK